MRLGLYHDRVALSSLDGDGSINHPPNIAVLSLVDLYHDRVELSSFDGDDWVNHPPNITVLSLGVLCPGEC